MRVEKHLPPAGGRFQFNRAAYDLLKSRLERSVSGAGVHSLASRLNQILNGCVNYCYWINEDIAERPDNYSLYNEYHPIRRRVISILDMYGEKDFWGRLIRYEEEETP
jgi:hypothetical protein